MPQLDYIYFFPIIAFFLFLFFVFYLEFFRHTIFFISFEIFFILQFWEYIRTSRPFQWLVGLADNELVVRLFWSFILFFVILVHWEAFRCEIVEWIPQLKPVFRFLKSLYSSAEYFPKEDVTTTRDINGQMVDEAGKVIDKKSVLPDEKPADTSANITNTKKK